MSGPFSGVRVLDLTGVVSGPFATMILADQGADVIKVEPLQGDLMRTARTVIADGFSGLMVSANRGKRSISIDIKSESGKEVLSKLVAWADVLVQNFRPGTMERLGFGADRLRERYPALIYVSISGVGETGPYVKKRVYDPIIQGLSGFADIQSQATTNRPQMIRTIVADKTTALFTAQAVSAALYAREKTGKGDHVRVAMLDAMISYLWPEGMEAYTVVGVEPPSSNANDVPDQVFETLNGFITVATVSESEWLGFCRAVGDPAFTDDARFATAVARGKNAKARVNEMAAQIKKRSSAEWMERLDAEDVPCGPVLRRSEIVENEQVVAREIFVEFDQPAVGRVRQPRPPARFDISESGIGGPAPRLGEHTRDVLRQLGYRDPAIEEMIKEKSVRALG
jgi:crotonobetainyl-CoA:carnitine CoA-transferase CaiB-like acyl-CoA transferase